MPTQKHNFRLDTNTDPVEPTRDANFRYEIEVTRIQAGEYVIKRLDDGARFHVCRYDFFNLRRRSDGWLAERSYDAKPLSGDTLYYIKWNIQMGYY